MFGSDEPAKRASFEDDDSTRHAKAIQAAVDALAARGPSDHSCVLGFPADARLYIAGVFDLRKTSPSEIMEGVAGLLFEKVTTSGRAPR